MNRDENTRPAPDKAEENTAGEKAEANRIFTVEEDNGRRPLDKTEGRMNNGETGGSNVETSGGNRR